MKSNCCKADVRVEGDTTKYYVCKKCNKACDIITNFFDLTEKEREEIVNEAVDKANKEQKELMDKYMPDIKQQLLEEFDKKFINDNYSYSTGNFNSIDPVVNKLKQFLSKAIDKTIEETIREVEEIGKNITVKDLNGKLNEDVIDFAQDIVNHTILKIKQSLNKLKK